ncbi:MAG: pyridine nucleotide-disulfide oxidoreductase [Chloroflexi bacterium]|nr:MAG: pyridine nucleotide-disulfide oxidoreductase [Chloroflexota bacterium]
MTQHYTYLIIGGGMSAAAAMEGIREVDATGSVGLISSDTHPPYNRPPLSKKLWTGKTTLAKIMRKTPDHASLHLGRSAQTLDLAGKQVTDDQGEVYTYEKLLLATGGAPRRLPFGADHILYFRTLDDYQYLRDLAEKHDRFAVIGGGFIGSEIAAALAMQGKQVTMLFPEAGIGQRIFPPEVVNHLNQYYRDKGVEVLAGESVNGVESTGERLAVLTQSGRRIEADGVVAGIGIQPNVALAASAGLKVDNGIVVNRTLQTSHIDVYAAGDVANFYDGVLQVQRRVEHEDNANRMGRAAGRAMAGDAAPYEYSPMFYSDLFDLGYEAVGELDSRLETVIDWQEPYQTGVLYYLKDRRVRGVLLWNVWGQVEAAKALIAAGQALTPKGLVGRIH